MPVRIRAKGRREWTKVSTLCRKSRILESMDLQRTTLFLGNGWTFAFVRVFGTSKRLGRIREMTCSCTYGFRADGKASAARERERYESIFGTLGLARHAHPGKETMSSFRRGEGSSSACFRMQGNASFESSCSRAAFPFSKDLRTLPGRPSSASKPMPCRGSSRIHDLESHRVLFSTIPLVSENVRSVLFLSSPVSRFRWTFLDDGAIVTIEIHRGDRSLP